VNFVQIILKKEPWIIRIRENIIAQNKKQSGSNNSNQIDFEKVIYNIYKENGSKLEIFYNNVSSA
jgi:hypothetical protein